MLKLKILSLFILSILITSLIYATNGTAVYRSNTGTFTTSSPKLKNWSSAGTGSYSAEFELPTAGSPIRYALIKYSPVSPKRVIITQSDDGYLDAYVSFDGVEWNITNNFGQVWTTAPATSSRRFDFEYETSTGDLIVVYSIVSASTTCDLAYRVMLANETTFGPEICIDDTTQTNDIQYTWVEAARKPTNSEEIIFVGFDSTSTDAVAYVWNGNSFGNIQEITANAPSTGGYKAIAVAYTYSGNQGMVAAGDGTTGNIATYYWSGTTWVNSPDFDIDPLDAADAYWLDLIPNPVSNTMQAVFVDSASDLGTAYWNGASWSVTSNIDTAVDAINSFLADFAWLPDGNSGRLVWDTDGGSGSTLSVRSCAPQCTSATTTISTYSGSGAWLNLYTNPTASDTVDIIGIRTNNVQNLGSFYFDGTNFVNYGDTVLTSTTGTTGSFSFDFQRAFDTIPPYYSNQNQSNNTIIIGSTNYLSVVWTDNVQLKTAILETNETGTWQNKTVYGSPVSMYGTYYVVNFSWNNSSIPAGTVIGWRVWASDRSNNWNVTPIMSFTVLAPPIYNFTVTPSTDSFTVYNNTYIDRNYTLNNTGNRNLSITCTTNESWVYNITACPSTLTPGSVINVTFRYNATGLPEGIRYVLINFTDSNAGTRNVTSTVNVTAVPIYNFTVTPSTDSFTVYNNTYIDRNYTLNNTGNRNLSITCTTNESWVYNITACPSTLTPGSVINVTFRYNATGLIHGNYLVNITFVDPNVTRYVLANVSVLAALTPSIYTDKPLYGTCNNIYFKVSVYDLNDQLIDAPLTNYLLDTVNTTVLSESVITGNGGTGIYLGIFEIPPGYTSGNWLIKTLSGSIKNQKTLQIS
ncbi:MAG: hypothetical protein QW771_00105 [Candidatus Micrarchaeia archaeon]